VAAIREEPWLFFHFNPTVMTTYRKYNEMTVEEKRHSIELWKRFYESLQEKNYEDSWLFWNKRMDYLKGIGIGTDLSAQRNEIFKNL
jgi:hypothetical protein